MPRQRPGSRGQIPAAAPARGATGSGSTGRRPAVAPSPRPPTGGAEDDNDTQSRPSFSTQPEGLSLRAKFMITLAALSGVSMVTLGLVLSFLARDYMFSQAKHKGIEYAKMTAQVARVVLDYEMLSGNEKLDLDYLRKRITPYLFNALNWGSDTSKRYSDVDLIQFNGGKLGGFGYGNEMSKRSMGEFVAQEVYIPRFGTVTLPKDADGTLLTQVYFTTKTLRDKTESEVCRFKVNLNAYRKAPQGAAEFDETSPPAYEDTEVWVDIRADTIRAFANKLITIVLLAVALTLGGVVYVSHLLAKRITKPVRQLMRDMQIVAKGDLDHRAKVRSKDEIGILAREFDAMTQNLKVAQAALVEQEKAAYELEIAKEVQAHLLPTELPQIAGHSVMAYYKGARQVSGDYYDVFPLGDGLWGFIVADVSGKGIPGSMVMAVTRTIVRLVAGRHRDHASDTLKDTNRMIAKQIKHGMFVTSFYAILDVASGRMVFASAGHNPMVIYRHAQRGYELAQPKGLAIGFNEGPLFDKTIQEFETVLGPGDGFVLYTDGFPEAMNERNEEFGDERFYQAIARYGANSDAKEIIKGLLGEVAAHRGRAAQSDDLTIIAVRRQDA